MKHPRLHKSLLKECPCSPKLSGDKYYGVPDIELEISEDFDNPKSVNLMYPLASIKTFYISIIIYFGFQISVHYFILMQIVQRH